MDDALETCRALAASDALAVILIGAPCDGRWAVEALRAGARGVLTQDARSEDLTRAVRVVHGGDLWVRRQWLHAWLRESATQLVGGHHLTQVRAQLDALLSRREREVSHQAATGISNREIAQRLGISEATVKVHLSRIFKKLGLGGRAGLAAAYHGAPRALVLEDAAPHSVS
jgi:DNA-binding NarL/FixJ family response regulator